MFKKLALLLLIPSLAFAEVLVYFKAAPEAVYRKIQGPLCSPNFDDNVVMDQPILIFEPEGSDKAFWSVLVPDARLTAIRAMPGFLGKGLTEVQTNKPAAYKKLTLWTWQLKTDNTVRYTVSKSDNTYQINNAYKKVGDDIPSQTFFGYDPWTGNPQ